MFLQDKVAIVTGATRGIGRVIAEELAREGASLILSGTNELLLSRLKDDISSENKEHVIVKGDISNPEIAEKLINKAISVFNRIDILVNNAGIATRTSTESMSLLDWQRVLDVNLSGTLYLCRKAIPIMKKQKSGKIINIASRVAKNPNISTSPSYGASKAGVIYLTRHLALELGPFGINVNAICPGPIETDMTKQWSDEDYQKFVENIPLKRFGKPEEVAQVVIFLASDLSTYITGESININGGYSMD